MFICTDPKSFREACRLNLYASPTGGQCPGYVQANLLILPGKHALDFQRFCDRNPVSCPLLGLTTGGNREIPASLVHSSSCDDRSDVCTDLPAYNVYSVKTGEVIETKRLSVESLWSDDLCAFYIGCSFSFETALDKNGLRPRHWDTGGEVTMYKTKYRLLPAGIFQGNMVVSMRPYKKQDVEKVRRTTAPFRATHGEPVAWGYEQARDFLGIEDISRPDFGEAPVDIREDEVPIFWGCGVTPQLIAMQTFARLHEEANHPPPATLRAVPGEVIIGHSPGHMLITDVREDAISSCHFV